ncbi:hypothetical protein CEXT_440191 [Caerostris extrusa]|uniref:Uncharacterized protein n=1 Tax=Caerostris extrusa TaxID=172846 RepID=A0AAV4XDP8_CAEEX|nr:hypothetical protein CEXT_440191 [Caerostris extrusa]
MLTANGGNILSKHYIRSRGKREICICKEEYFIVDGGRILLKKVWPNGGRYASVGGREVKRKILHCGWRKDWAEDSLAQRGSYSSEEGGSEVVGMINHVWLCPVYGAMILRRFTIVDRGGIRVKKVWPKRGRYASDEGGSEVMQEFGMINHVRICPIYGVMILSHDRKTSAQNVAEEFIKSPGRLLMEETSFRSPTSAVGGREKSAYVKEEDSPLWMEEGLC